MNAPDRAELIVYCTEDGQLPEASAVKEYLTTAKGGKLSVAATVKESLTIQNEARQVDAEELAELARIEKRLEQKKETR